MSRSAPQPASPPPNNRQGRMPTTRWSIVRAAGGNATERRQALEIFARDYWPAIYSFIRIRGSQPAEAEDLTQSFLASLIERDSLAKVEEPKGRFRSWLLGALKNFLKADYRDRHRLKRGGAAEHISIDQDLGEAWLESSAMDHDSPESIFERRWAWGILERAVAELTNAYRRADREHVVQVLAPIALGMNADTSYAQAAETLGISHANARVMAFRLRKHLRELVREEMAHTVATPEEIEEELDHFFVIFGSKT